jgi:hypothetical protein
MSEVDNASCTLNGDLKTHLLFPAECLVQELDRASNKRSRRVVAAGNPPSNRDSHRVQSTWRHEFEVPLSYECAPVVLEIITKNIQNWNAILNLAFAA